MFDPIICILIGIRLLVIYCVISLLPSGFALFLFRRRAENFLYWNVLGSAAIYSIICYMDSFDLFLIWMNPLVMALIWPAIMALMLPSLVAARFFRANYRKIFLVNYATAAMVPLFVWHYTGTLIEEQCARVGC